MFPSRHSVARTDTLVPKGMYLFYKEFVRPSLSEKRWKERLMAAEGGSPIALPDELAFAVMFLENYWDAWVYDIKIHNSSFCTEYDTRLDVVPHKVSFLDLYLEDTEIVLAESAAEKSHFLVKGDSCYDRARKENQDQHRSIATAAKSEMGSNWGTHLIAYSCAVHPEGLVAKTGMETSLS